MPIWGRHIFYLLFFLNLKCSKITTINNLIEEYIKLHISLKTSILLQLFIVLLILYTTNIAIPFDQYRNYLKIHLIRSPWAYKECFRWYILFPIKAFDFSSMVLSRDFMLVFIRALIGTTG